LPESSAHLTDKRILITGASGGIGQAVARCCVAGGAFVYLAGRNADRLQALQSELGEQVQWFCYDVCDEQAVRKAFGEIQASGLDGLVNGAGVMLDAGLATTKLASVRSLFETNATAAFLHLQLASRLMMRKRSGSIVNLASQVGEQGSAGQTAYTMSKAAVSGLTKSAAKELAPFQIRVNAVAPGFIDTAMTKAYQGDRQQQVIQKISLGRAGSTEDVAALVSFLLSDQAGYITGQVMAVDGGMRL